MKGGLNMLFINKDRFNINTMYMMQSSVLTVSWICRA